MSQQADTRRRGTPRTSPLSVPRLGSLLSLATWIACGPADVDRAPPLPGAPDTTTPDTREIPDRVRALGELMAAPLYECPDRVWPDTAAAYRSAQILLTSQNPLEAYLWNAPADPSNPGAEAPSWTRVDARGLSPGWFAAYNIDEYRNVPTLGVSLDFTRELNDLAAQQGGFWHDYALVLALHEGFHAFSGQLAWQVSPLERAVPYPGQLLPRYLRAQIVRALQNDLFQPDNLGAVAFWHDRFVRETPDDYQALRGLDAIEGSAQYATLIGSAIAAIGCNASDAELHGAALDHLAEFATNLDFSGNAEAYSIGALAGLALRRDGVDGWHASVVAGIPPLETLLAGISAVPQPDDEQLQSAVTTSVDARNQLLAPDIDALVARTASTDHYRIPVSPAWIQGAFSAQGFVTLTEVPDRPGVVLRMSAVLSVPPRSVAVTVEALSVMEGFGPTPCSDVTAEWVLAVPKAEVTSRQAGVFDASGGSVRFSGLPARVVGSAGLDWLCPGE